MSRAPRVVVMPSTGRPILRTILILLFAAVILVGTVSVTAAGVLRRLSPEWALRFMPFDARANAALANQVITQNGARGLETAQGLAVRALMRDPSAVDAAATLGIVASLQRRDDLADLRFQFAERMSRRDLATQLWFIERMVRANNIAGALRHYDIALSTSPVARQQLVPILIAASSDPAIASTLRNLLHTTPVWRDYFVNRLTAEGPDPRAMVYVTRGVLDPQVPSDREYLKTMLTRLVQMRAFDSAWEAWRNVTRDPEAGVAGVRDGQFRIEDGLAPFYWTYAAEPGLIPERRPREGAAAGFALYLPASDRDGEIARQLLRLSSGRHEIQADVGDVGADPRSRPHLLLRCAAEAGATLLDQPFPSTPGRVATMEASVSIPPNCPFQWIAIQVHGDLAGEDAASPWIGSIRVR